MDDLLIIGGSAAGTAAAIYAARRGLKVRVVAIDLGGEVAQSGEIENWPGTIHTTGVELATAFEAHLRSYPVPIEVGVVIESIDRKLKGTFLVTGKRDDAVVRFTAKAVIATTGVHPRLLGIPGEKEFKNKGVSYCTVCDGPLYRNKVTVTIGGGNSALESALMLATFAQSVTILTINPAMQGEAVLINKLKNTPNVTIIPHAATTNIIGDQFVTGLIYEDTVTKKTHQLPADGVFIHVGMIPNSDCLHGLKKNEFGEVVTNKLGETSVPGLFAAGDVTDMPFKQIAIAAGQGVTAALQAARYLDSLK